MGAKASGNTVGLASSTEKDEDDEDTATFSDLKAWAMSKTIEKSDEPEEPLHEIAVQIAEEKGIAAVNEEALDPVLTEREDPIACIPAQLKTNTLEPPLVSNPSEPIGIVPEVETEPSDSEPVDLSTRRRDSTPLVSGSFTLTDDGRPVAAEKLECPVCSEEFEV